MKSPPPSVFHVINLLVFMAPHLAAWKHDLIRNMIIRNSLNTAQMAEVADCSDRSIRSIRSNLHCFGTTRAPTTRVGRPRSITPTMLDVLREYLFDKPELNLDKMVVSIGQI
jgi:hypothetical protein